MLLAVRKVQRRCKADAVEEFAPSPGGGGGGGGGRKPGIEKKKREKNEMKCTQVEGDRGWRDWGLEFDSQNRHYEGTGEKNSTGERIQGTYSVDIVDFYCDL